MKLRNLVSACPFAVVALLWPACIHAQSTKDATAPEPEILSTVYYLDAAKNALTTLERLTAKGSSGMFHGSAEIKSERSPVRIDGDSAQDFVVSLPAGVDPSKFELFLMEVKKGKRRTVMASAKLFSVQVGKNSIAIAAKRYGNAAYKLSPVQKLPPGEYCFSPSDSNDTFCFGIDGKK
jgi:hypothetical protein